MSAPYQMPQGVVVTNVVIRKGRSVSGRAHDAKDAPFLRRQSFLCVSVVTRRFRHRGFDKRDQQREGRRLPIRALVLGTMKLRIVRTAATHMRWPVRGQCRNHRRRIRKKWRFSGCNMESSVTPVGDMDICTQVAQATTHRHPSLPWFSKPKRFPRSSALSLHPLERAPGSTIKKIFKPGLQPYNYFIQTSRMF